VRNSGRNSVWAAGKSGGDSGKGGGGANLGGILAGILVGANLRGFWQKFCMAGKSGEEFWWGFYVGGRQIWWKILVGILHGGQI
jgi:hypothetical protein